MHIKHKGFTIIELMIVLAIILILGIVAIPNYSKNIYSTRRTEARAALLDYAMLFEEYYTSNYTYNNANTTYGLQNTPATENGYYKISATIASGGTGYTLTATAQGSQAKDTTCATMTLNNLNQKTPTACW